MQVSSKKSGRVHRRSPDPPAEGATTRLTVVHVNDTHSHLFPFLALHGGDAIVGSTNRYLADGDPDYARIPTCGWRGIEIIETMNLLGFDAMAIGNHELDSGKRWLAAGSVGDKSLRAVPNRRNELARKVPGLHGSLLVVRAMARAERRPAGRRGIRAGGHAGDVRFRPYVVPGHADRPRSAHGRPGTGNRSPGDRDDRDRALRSRVELSRPASVRRESLPQLPARITLTWVRTARAGGWAGSR
jgi:hypothetical protein